MEASDLVHEVSEAAERRPDAEADDVAETVSTVEEIEEDDESDSVEIVGQRVAAEDEWRDCRRDRGVGRL